MIFFFASKSNFLLKVIAQLGRKIIFSKNQHGDNVTLFIP